MSAGIVVVVAGRDRPRWPEAGRVKLRTEIPEAYLHLEGVGHLAAEDARAYLRTFGITDVALCESLIIYASVNSQDRPDRREIHPLHLGLCTDVVLEAADKVEPLNAGDFATVLNFEDKGDLLIERLLLYVNEDIRYAIQALNACRAFDFEIYRLLGHQLNFIADWPTFVRLTNFSFVWQAEQRGENWYRIHDLMRRLDNHPQVEQAHQVLAEHYQAQGEIEAIYHKNRLDWQEGVDLWLNEFDQALKLSRYELCRVLLDIRRELTIQSPFKLRLISYSEGEYYQNLALYAAAQQEYEEAIVAYDDAALQRAPDDITALNNKGLTLRRLADLQTKQSQHSDARSSYREAIAAYVAALQRAPDDITALNNKGNALKNLADLQATQLQAMKALKSREEALTIFTRSLMLAPNNADIRQQHEALTNLLGDEST